VGQDVGVDREDVGHRGEGGEARLEFAGGGGAVTLELKYPVEHGSVGV